MSYESHLTEHDIERLLQERMSCETTRAAHQHLWVCGPCRSRLLQNADSALYLEEIYGAEAVAYWRTTLAERSETWPALIERSIEISSLAAQHLYMKTRNNATFQDPTTLVLALERGYELRKQSPYEAQRLLSGLIAALHALDHWPQEARGSFLARALAYRGNIHRILSERAAAVKDFAAVHAYLARNNEPPLAGLLATFEGTLEKEAGRYETAIAKLRKAVTLLPQNGEPVSRLEASIILATTYGLACNWKQSATTLRALVEQHSASQFPHGTYLASLHGLAYGYTQLVQPDKAEELLAEIWRVARKEGNRLDLVRVRWLEAEIFKARGNRTLAASRFRAVTSQFMAAELPVDAAIAALSQAGMYLDLGDTRAAAALADDLVPIFRSKGIHREATAAGLIVVEDLRRQAATAGQLQELVGRLQGRETKS